MSNQEPDGCVLCKQPFSDKNVHSEAGWREIHISHMCEDCFDEVVKEADDEDDMVSIPPQELTRLRLIAAWAKHVRFILKRVALGDGTSDQLAKEFRESYAAITAPEDKEGGFTCCLCGLRIKGRPYHYTDKGDVCVSCFDYEAETNDQD